MASSAGEHGWEVPIEGERRMLSLKVADLSVDYLKDLKKHQFHPGILWTPGAPAHWGLLSLSRKGFVLTKRTAGLSFFLAGYFQTTGEISESSYLVSRWGFDGHLIGFPEPVVDCRLEHRLDSRNHGPNQARLRPHAATNMPDWQIRVSAFSF